MKNIIHYTFSILGFILVADFLCFMAWVLSGQLPTSGFYFGCITKNIIGLII